MKKGLLLYVVLLLLCSLSCGQKERSGLPQERLVPLLVDVHIAEASFQQALGSTKDSLAAMYYDQIYTLHGISAEEFQAELEYLRRHPKFAETVYDQVLDELSKMNLTGNKETTNEDKKK